MLSNAFCKNINGKIDTYLGISGGINIFKIFTKRILLTLVYLISNILYSGKKKGKKRGLTERSKNKKSSLIRDESI